MKPRLSPEREKLSSFIKARLSEGKDMNGIVDEVRKMTVEEVLVTNRGNITSTSKTLGLSRGTTSKIIKK